MQVVAMKEKHQTLSDVQQKVVLLEKAVEDELNLTRTLAGEGLPEAHMLEDDVPHDDTDIFEMGATVPNSSDSNDETDTVQRDIHALRARVDAYQRNSADTLHLLVATGAQAGRHVHSSCILVRSAPGPHYSIWRWRRFHFAI